MGEKPKILVVDDSPPVLKLMRAVLRNFEMIPLTAETGPEAVEVIRAQDPDLVIVDMNIPDTSARELVAEIRRTSNRENLPMIILSGEPVDDDDREATGITVSIMKPFDVTDLIDSIRKELQIADS